MAPKTLDQNDRENQVRGHKEVPRFALDRGNDSSIQPRRIDRPYTLAEADVDFVRCREVAGFALRHFVKRSRLALRALDRVLGRRNCLPEIKIDFFDAVIPSREKSKARIEALSHRWGTANLDIDPMDTIAAFLSV